MVEAESKVPDRNRIHLWNPNVAANWSILFTPVFGAMLHASNWRALGKPERAAANIRWAWTYFLFLIVVIGTVFVPDSPGIDIVLRLVGLGLLIGWYFREAKPQVQYVKNLLGDNYIKKQWGRPLMAGVAGVAAFLALNFFLALATYTLDPKELATQVRPLILREWQRKSELRGATIEDLTLEHTSGNTYTGFITANLKGKTERLGLEVTCDGQTIAWQIKAPGE